VERIQFPLSYVWGVAGHLNGVRNSPELREAYENAQPDVVKASMRMGQSTALYGALKRVSSADDTADDFASSQKRRAVNSSLRSMEKSGVGLEGEQKERFNTISLRMAELTTKFSNNILDCTKDYGLEVIDADSLAEAPETARAMWAGAFAAKANEDLEEGAKKI